MSTHNERMGMRRLLRLGLVVVASIAALAIAGCGGSGSSSSSSTSVSLRNVGAGKPVQGGTATVLEVAGGVDNLDPAFWYYQTDYADLYRTTQRGLYSFTASGVNPVPDLATGMPVATDGNKTLTIHIRSGIHYSPPLQSTTVTSADVKYAMERCFLTSAGADNYVSSYYNQIVGAPAGHVTKLPNITGLQTPNASTLVIKTTAPVGVLVNANALSLPCTVPVPEKYAAKYDVGAQSSYGMHQVFTGPYMIQGAGSGTVPSTGYQPGKLLVLVRNPSFQRSTDPLVGAYLNQITFKGGNDITVASRQILTGSSMMSGDFAAPPTSILQQALTSSQKSQFHILPSDGNRYITLNVTVPPLNNINVRRAIAAVIDKNALRLTRGGPALGTIATHFIPPGLLGFTEAGGNAGPSADFNSNPNGNVTLAESYLKKAGYPSGKYTGPPLLTVADNTSPASNTALAVQSELAQIGIKETLREVPHATMLTKFCEIAKAKVAICPNTGWGKDFNDSQSMIDPVFNGAALGASTTNMSQVNDPALNKQIDAAKQLTDSAQRAAAWGKLDQEITTNVYVVPWLWDNDITFASKNVQIANWTFDNNDWDFANSYLKKG